jgi:predicted GTPase
VCNAYSPLPTITGDKKLLDSWIEAAEGPKRIDAASQPAGSKEMAIDRPHYNVAIVGITGVGKSALVNYLFGERVAATGLGRPVTKRGFASYEFRIGELPVKLFDSWGLEVDKVDEWMKSLNEELSLRGTDRPAEEWFHTILYCINAAGRRLLGKQISNCRDSNESGLAQ